MTAQAEQALLGSILTDPSQLPKARAVLSGPSFSEQSHVAIWSALCELEDSHRMINAVTLASTLASHNLLEKAGGHEYLATLLDMGTDPDACSDYAALIREDYARRAIRELALRMLSHGDASRNPYVILGEAREAIDTLTASKLDKRLTSSSSLVTLTSEAIAEATRLGGRLPGITTGFTSLDALTGGLQKTDFWIIGARPSVGKSSAAINLVHAACERAGKSVLLCSLEMSALQVGLRIRAMDSGVDLQRIRFGSLNDSEQQGLDYSSKRLNRWKLWVDDTPAISLSDIRAKALSIKSNHGLDVLIVDYIGIMGAESGRDSRALEVSKIAAGLKVIAKELDVCVVGLSQLRRMGNAHEERPPTLEDLKESGGLEENADIVVLLHRHADTALSVCEWIVAKQRNGPTGALTLGWTPSTASFQDFVQVDGPGDDGVEVVEA